MILKSLGFIEIAGLACFLLINDQGRFIFQITKNMSNSVLDRLDEPKVETISLVYRGTDKILKIIVNF